MTTEVQFTHADVWFRLDKAPWSDPRVRKAVALALDREDFIASNRGGAIYSGFIPAAMPDFAWPEAKVKEKFPTDREAAGALGGYRCLPREARHRLRRQVHRAR